MSQLDDDMKQVYVYASGPKHLSVCVPKKMAIERVAATVNSTHPPGTQSQWQKSDEDFKDGKSNPCPCNDEPERLHYLFTRLTRKAREK